MAKLAMQRIEIVALIEDRKKLIERLQRRGIVEICDNQSENLARMNTEASISQFEKGIHSAILAKEILEEFAPAKKSLLSALNGRRIIDTATFGQSVEQRDAYIKNCYDIINAAKIIKENRAAIIRTQTLMDALTIWLDLDIPMQYKGTKNTACFIGSLPNPKTSEEVVADILALNAELEMVHVEVISTYKEQTCVKVFCHSDIAAATLDALRKLGFVQPADPTKHVPKVRMQRYEKEIEKYKSEIEEQVKFIKSNAGKMGEIEFLIDYLTIRKDKYAMLSRLGHTKNTFIITGYIPEKYAQKCVDELESRFTVAITLSAPAEDEDVPVLFENNGFVSPVEPITAMYAWPTNRDVDPNPFMAFFYYMFFGLMLSDAGYGVIMVIGTAIALKKFNLEAPLRKTLKMFFYCGISTVFWGAMLGSWFGDIVPIICTQFLHIDAPNMALWFEPIKDPIRFLLAAFAFGIIHLFAGLAINFKISWSEGRKWDAILDVIPIYLFVLGVAPLCVGVLVSVPAILTTVGQYMAIVGVIAIILTAGRSSKNIFARLGLGLYGMYNVAGGYLSDVLSYSRLLALGLATGSIAGVVNLIGSMPSNLVVKGISLTLVFIIGHPLNMAINVLGAYVHTNRLQFVEFFSKFYEGGGRAFNPLKINSQYIKIKEEQ